VALPWRKRSTSTVCSSPMAPAASSGQPGTHWPQGTRLAGRIMSLALLSSPLGSSQPILRYPLGREGWLIQLCPRMQKPLDPAQCRGWYWRTKLPLVDLIRLWQGPRRQPAADNSQKPFENHPGKAVICLAPAQRRHGVAACLSSATANGTFPNSAGSWRRSCQNARS
jgi:hypothetical protein